MRIDTAGVLSATVESLHLENKLLVFSFKGGANVWVERSRWIILHGRQELFVPAVVSYYVDLSQLRFGEDVKLDPDGKTVRVKLPPLVLGDMAFEPEKATTINGGLLTFSEEEVEELRKINFATARKAIVKQAQGQSLIAIAKRQARDNISNYLEIPLRAAGASDVKVVATF
ncbi:DUF4230 domain-containing protein [uncultured Sphingobium sp.]|uniref:DUF4230 domain-containing protein n=1 Tax=uncultured Sphingobium sp. TaxID=316087 RepID=UPI00258BFB6E|nr:DUF4230 domain-containing protein [uncultured Sphingobium sp.]